MTLGGGMCWGLSGSMGQFLFQHEGMDSRWLVPIRLFLAGVILFIFCFVKHRKPLFQIWTKRRDALLLLAYGLAGVSACQFTYFLTIQLSSAGVGTILQDLSPVMILVCACIAGRRAPKPYEIICIALALAGVTLIVTHGDFGSLAVSEGALISGSRSFSGRGNSDMCRDPWDLWASHLSLSSEMSSRSRSISQV